MTALRTNGFPFNASGVGEGDKKNPNKGNIDYDCKLGVYDISLDIDCTTAASLSTHTITGFLKKTNELLLLNQQLVLLDELPCLVVDIVLQLLHFALEVMGFFCDLTQNLKTLSTQLVLELHDFRFELCDPPGRLPAAAP